MVVLRLTCEGDDELDRTLVRWADRIGDMTPAWENIDEYLAAIADDNFEHEGASQGEPWQDITDAYRDYKIANDLDPRILHATFRMRRSLAETTHPEHFFMAWPDRMMITSLVPYFKYHQSRQARSKLPRRPALAWNEMTKHEAANRAQEFVIKGVISRGNIL